MKKFNYEFVKSEFYKENYTLLSKEYIDINTLLEFRCSNNHIHKISFSAWRKGQRCKKCMDDSLRLSIDYVREYFKENGYHLLDSEYINARQYLKVICPIGHLTKCTFSNFKSGFRCKYCAKNVRYSLEFIEGEFIKEGYTLITSYYKNQKQKLKYICPLGHQHEITWTDWYNGGYRCPTCYAIRITGKGNHGWKGGISKAPYGEIWTKRLKKEIRERDNYKCLNPYCYSKNPNDLVVHHINYDKKDCEKKNLITICRACNNRAGIDCRWHMAWYQAIMYRRYNYNY